MVLATEAAVALLGPLASLLSRRQMASDNRLGVGERAAQFICLARDLNHELGARSVSGRRSSGKQ